MATASCIFCGTVVDTETAKKRTIGKQVDIICPKCGRPVTRSINGKDVPVRKEGKYSDPSAPRA
jgi:endogenous inhibitor of DNA gyrase (YacG/DUF329 family)